MKKTFEKPSIQLIKFETTDVIRTSGTPVVPGTLTRNGANAGTTAFEDLIKKIIG